MTQALTRVWWHRRQCLFIFAIVLGEAKFYFNLRKYHSLHAWRAVTESVGPKKAVFRPVSRGEKCWKYIQQKNKQKRCSSSPSLGKRPTLFPPLKRNGGPVDTSASHLRVAGVCIVVVVGIGRSNIENDRNLLVHSQTNYQNIPKHQPKFRVFDLIIITTYLRHAFVLFYNEHHCL